MSDRFDEQMEENASFIERLAPSPLTRRRMLLGGGVGALALVAAACGSEEEEDPSSTGDPTTSTTAASGGGGGGGDVAIAQTAAGLEVLAVNTYNSALEAPLDYPPAVAEFATTARDHHQAHLDAWNELLTTLGESEVTEPLEPLAGEVMTMFEAVTDVTGVAELALLLEETAASTYFAVIPTIENAEALELAATIQPIDMQHAAILNYVMGEYPVPDTFANAEQSVTA
ncbi:MAG: ferritin-like domain-containing protein [Actinomycetota bacterium]|nr:ferritin-like domain-containing protein [Actinomycetota bacterium]